MLDPETVLNTGTKENPVFEYLSPAALKKLFRMDKQKLVWARDLAFKIKEGTQAGYATPNQKGGLYSLRVRIQGLPSMKVEDIAFAIQTGRLSKGKIAHKDGNTQNNHIDNLVELGG